MDNLSREDRVRTMRAVKGMGTGLERRVRAMLAGRRISGWKVHPAGIVGNPDFTFVGRKIALFIDGCFWHGCPVCQRPLPVANADYWKRKIARNVERDSRNRKRLETEGWLVLSIWEHELKRGKRPAILRKLARKATEWRER